MQGMASPLVDLSAWTTDRLTQVYVELLLHEAPLDAAAKADLATVQAEWARRPAADRAAALQRCHRQHRRAP